jgi:hypothetical protein
MNQRYCDGRDIRLGDRVAYNAQRGRIVFVADRGEYAKEYEPKNYPSGFMIEFDNGARLLLETADDMLVLENSGA